MRLYDIDDAIAELIDEETGEIVDFEAFENLNIERERKIEFLCKSIKEAPLLMDALQTEISRLQEKKASIKRNADKLKSFLQGYLGGEKYKSPLFTCYESKTKVVTGNMDGFRDWCLMEGRTEFLKFSDPEVSVSSVKSAIADGEKIPYVQLEEKKFLCIK
jgi:hypothetical protein